jgi:hypothetical protein
MAGFQIEPIASLLPFGLRYKTAAEILASESLALPNKVSQHLSNEDLFSNHSPFW